MLFLFLLSYLIFFYWNYSEIDAKKIIKVLIAPIVFYYLGSMWGKKYPFRKVFYFVLILLPFAVSFIPFLSNVVDVMENGFMTNRSIKVIYSDSDFEIAATNLGAKFALNMSLLPLLFIKTKERWNSIYNRSIIVLFFMGTFSLLNMSTRTGIVISIISVIATLILFSRSQGIRILFIIFLFIVIISPILIETGFIGIIKESNIYYRFFFEIEEKNQGTLPRFVNWSMALQGLFDYPLGGEKSIIATNFAHNFWLDIGRQVGVIPLFFLIIVTFRYLLSIKKNFKIHQDDIRIQVFLILYSIAFLATFFMEPIMYGYEDFFILFCFVWSFISSSTLWRYLNSRELNRRKKESYS